MGDALLLIDDVLARLSGVRQTGDSWMAQCPVHDDSTPSLSVSIGREGRILLKCHAHCEFRDIVSALGLKPQQLLPSRERPTTAGIIPQITATYDYRDADGVLRYQVCRFEPGKRKGEKKDFRQRRPNGAGGWTWDRKGVEQIPYRLNELKGHPIVYLPEGEKDCDNLWAIGCPATTNVGGGTKWKDCDSEALKAVGVQRVILLPDNDATGKKHVEIVARSVKQFGIAVVQIVFPDMPPKSDVSDWLQRGGTKAELEQLVATKPWVVPKGSAVEDDYAAAQSQRELEELQKKTDVGMAAQFAEMFGTEFRFNHFRKYWLHYESPCWRPDADMAVYRAAVSFARAKQKEATKLPAGKEKTETVAFFLKAEGKGALDRLTDVARWDLSFSDRGDDWDADPMALAVNNGILDLRTGQLRPGHPSDRISMKCTVPYDPEAQCPRWWQFLSEIFGDAELIEFVWRLCGYILTGQTTERIVPMFYGRGANGKSVLLNVFATLLGDYAFSLPFSSMQFQKQAGIPNDLAALVGKRLVTMIEANDGLRLDEAKLKTLSGNDRISARFLHGEFFQFQPVAKFVLAMNHKPVAKDDSPGFWERIRLVPFTHTFPLGQRDENLQKFLIEKEGSGILSWAVQGCLRWQESGLTKPAIVVEATAEYQADSDQLAEFLAACTDSSDRNALTGASELQKAYSGWADSRGLGRHERLSATTFGRLIAERFKRQRNAKGIYYCGLHVFSGNLW